MLLVDTHVLLDLVIGDAAWADWSQQQLETAALRDRLAINSVIYAELSIGFERIEDLDDVLEITSIELAETPRCALFLAGKVFRRYRRRGGTKTGVLPDFFIGAHATVTRSALVTRDPARYRSYFPEIALITPVSQPAAGS